MKYLVVVDMQNDFIDGALGTPEAQAIVPKIVKKIEEFGGAIFYTMDTHGENYLDTQEGKLLPVKHCIYKTDGDEKLDRRIEKMYDANLHKLCPMPSYNPARLWAMPTEV